MRLQKQLISGDALANQAGDCYRTAIACLLNLDAKDVPHFYEDAATDHKTEWDVEGAIEQWIDAWLISQGYIRIRAVITNMGRRAVDVIAGVAMLTPTGYPALLSGLSQSGISHVIIVRDGALVWDPSPSNSGLFSGYGEEGTAWVAEWLARPIEMEDR